MTLLQMQYFRQVCKDKTVSQAAKSLHLSQPSISNSIQELEAELGVNLFHRIKLRLSLTKEGEVFLERVSQILNEISRLEEQMKDLGQKRNRIRLGIPPMIGTIFLPVILDSFFDAYPEIKIEIAETGSLGIREMLSKELLDIAIMSVDGEEKDHQFEAVQLYTASLFYCVAKTHPLAQRDAINLQEVAGEQLILFHDTFYINDLITRRFSDQGLKPNVLLASDQLYTVKRLLLKRRCGAFLYGEVIDMEHELVGIPLAEPIQINVCMIWKKGKALYSDVSKLIQFMRANRDNLTADK